MFYTFICEYSQFPHKKILFRALDAFQYHKLGMSFRTDFKGRLYPTEFSIMKWTHLFANSSQRAVTEQWRTKGWQLEMHLPASSPESLFLIQAVWQTHQIGKFLAALNDFGKYYKVCLRGVCRNSPSSSIIRLVPFQRNSDTRCKQAHPSLILRHLSEGWSQQLFNPTHNAAWEMGVIQYQEKAPMGLDVRYIVSSRCPDLCM